MVVWQKRARFVVAVFGIAGAVLVYFAIGRRPPVVAQPAVNRIDPSASIESRSANVQRFSGAQRSFEISSDTQLSYPDGRTRMIKVTIRVKKQDGHSYLVTAGEAESTQDQSHLQLSSGVHLKADDGFELSADRGTYTKADGLIHSDVPVTFSKARMSGSGTMVDYNETSDVLSVAQDARVTTVDEQGATTLEFTAGTAVLDRYHDILTLDGKVHVLRDMQVMDSDRSVAHLAPNEEFVTSIEMRGSSRVSGGAGTLDAMSARDIDLDYTDDGKLLERVVLNGMAGLTMKGASGGAGRQLLGEALEVKLGPDGAVTDASGRENVRMRLPASDGAPARTVQGRVFDAIGAPGAGLTAAHFTDAVEYREEAFGSAGSRTVHSRRLDLALAGDAVTGATFTGEVVFEEPSFRAQSAEARYDPAAGTLHLTGGDNRGLPCVADERIAVDAQTIDVAVESRRLKATGAVKSALRPDAATAGATSPCAIALRAAGRSNAAAAADTKLPGLLKQDQIVNGSADALEYGGTGQTLTFTGGASLFQGEDTSMRGDTIRVEQESGNLSVTGNARSVIVSGSGDQAERTNGRAEQISYTDSLRRIEYLNTPAGAQKPSKATVRVTGPQGDLQANTVEVFLRKDDGRADRLEAWHNVTAKIDTKTVTADRLTYLADKDQYDMQGVGAIPARIVDGCAESSGKTVTYYKGDNRTIVDGKDELRVQSKSAGCQPSSPSSR
jgi:LPS export ABC transporter protein LptC